jgi:succinate dehydrogenase cytochrome b556 subunit
MKINRPLSPHLTIYKPQLTSTLSIFHRISGGFLASLLLFSILSIKICELGLSSYEIYWFFFYVTSSYFWFLLSLANLALLALCYHMSNGIRHLVWDFGFFLDLSKVYITGAFVLIFSGILLVLLSILRIYFI